MAQFAELITYREVLRREPTLTELRALLAKYARADIILLLSKLNCLLGTWQNAPDFDMDARLSRILLASYLQQVEAIRRASAIPKVTFSRITILYLAKQACHACLEQGHVPNTPESYADVGVCCLLANDLLLPFVPSPTDSTLQRLASLLPFSDYIAHDHYPMEIARSQTLFDDVSQSAVLRARPDFLDVREIFQQHVGLSHLTFCELVFACSTKFLRVKPEELESPEAFVMRETFFRNSTIPNDVVQQFFRKLTITESRLAERIKNSPRPGDDFTIFQTYPLVELAAGIHTCLDPGFLVEKAGRGLYWTMFLETPNEQRPQLAAFWGVIFEAYVNSIVEQAYAAGGEFMREPRFSNGEPAFDACLLEGGRLVVFEHKSSTLRADCKYGGVVTSLENELRLKFVQGDEEGAKGLAQLNRNLIRFLRGDDINGIGCKDVRKIYPVLVCLDNSVVVPYMGRYFKEQFQASFPRREFRQVVTPVFTLSISDVENLLGYLASFKLSDVFDSYYTSNRAFMTSLSSSTVPLLRDAQPGVNAVREGFTAFGRRVEKDLFGHPPNEGAD